MIKQMFELCLEVFNRILFGMNRILHSTVVEGMDASWLSGAQSALQRIQNSFGVGQYPMTTVTSKVDGRSYKVRDMPDKQQAADLIARVRMNMKKLYMHLESTFPDKPQVKRLKERFIPNAERLLESTPDAEHTSYSVNKGEAVHLCLRQRQGADETLVQDNVMTFVAIHEMAHMITDSIGHEPEFWNNFGWLLKEAEKTGVYKYQDFKEHPVRYCGTKITDQPRYDPAKDGADMTIGQLSL